MGITLREASEKVGVTRQTLMKAIKTGRVSAEKSENGEWRIEPVELFRVWPPVNEVQQPLQPELTGSDTFSLQAENRLLQQKLEMVEQANTELREERNAWREQAQRLALTDQRAAPQSSPRPGFWSRLFSRQGDSPSGGEV
jgi:hypothetical protein